MLRRFKLNAVEIKSQWYASLFALILAIFFIGCGGDDDNVEVVVLTATIEGRVMDGTTQQGIGGAEVRLNTGLSTKTGPDGRFVFEDVESDTYTLSVSARGYLKTETRIKVPHEGATTTVRLQPGVSVFGVVTSEDGFAVSHVRISLGERAGITNGQGRYEISPVENGQYDLVAEKPGYGTVHIRNIVVGDTDLERNFSIQRHLTGQILFSRANVINQTFFGLSVTEADGTRVTQLTSFFDEHPTWSPDGTEIAFTRSEANAPRQIYRMDSRSLIENNLSGTYQNDRHPAWSPDGRQIAFVHAEILEPAAIYLMSADGGDRVRLAECYQGATPTWSPDGTRIAFSRNIRGNRDLFVVDIDAFIRGQNKPPEEPQPQPPEEPQPQPPEPPPDKDALEEGVRTLTDNPEDDVHPDWNPDGSKMAFTVEENARDADVYILDLFSLRQTRLTDGIGYNGYPCWSLDGTKIAFSSNRDGSFGIWVIDADGSNMTRVYDKLGEDEILSQEGWRE